MLSPIKLLIVTVSCAVLLSACADAGISMNATQLVVTATPDAQPSPTPSPFVNPLLDPEAVWIGVDGMSRAVVAVLPDSETVIRVALPLNEGQQASNITASANGSYLAYLVWDAEGNQLGIASWDIALPDAHLVAKPDDNHRIIGLYLADNADGIAYVQVETGAAPEFADWYVSVVPAEGGTPRKIADRVMMDDAAPPEAFAWPADGPLLLNPAVPDVISQGIYAVNPATGTGRQLFPVENQIIVGPSLAPDGTRMAFLTFDPDALQSPESGEPGYVVRVRDLRLDEMITLTGDPAQSILGLRWHRDGERILLDIIAPSPDDPAQKNQQWAFAPANGEGDWTVSPLSAGRAGLFDYQPFGEGVIYTLLPAGEVWAVYVLDSLSGTTPPRRILLEALMQENGAPTILYIPHIPQIPG